MRGVGNLTRATYANQRMTLTENFAKVKDKAEYDDRATWSNPCGVFLLPNDNRLHLHRSCSHELGFDSVSL